MIIAGWCLEGLAVPIMRDGCSNRRRFLDIGLICAPTLSPGGIVTMGNLSSHTGDKVHKAIEAASATQIVRPPKARISPQSGGWAPFAMKLDRPFS